MEYLQIVALVGVFAVFYFLMIRPQRKKQKQVDEMRRQVKPGDRITTIGGIKGRVVRTSDEVITIQVGSDKVKFEIMRWAISRVDESKEGRSTVSSESKEEPAKEEGEETLRRPKKLGAKSDADSASEAETQADSDYEAASEPEEGDAAPEPSDEKESGR
jgi:preprotein translocase subunit YajC